MTAEPRELADRLARLEECEHDGHVVVDGDPSEYCVRCGQQVAAELGRIEAIGDPAQEPA